MKKGSTIGLLLLFALGTTSCASFIQWVDRYDRPAPADSQKEMPEKKKKCCHCPPSPSTISCQADKLNQSNQTASEE